jgi:integrase
MIPRSADNPYIICGDIPGEPLVNLDAMWRRIRIRTGFHDLRIHDLRRTVGSWLVRDGASLHLVGAVLNHKDQKTTAATLTFKLKIASERWTDMVRRSSRLPKMARAGQSMAHPQPGPHKRVKRTDFPGYIESPGRISMH